MSGGLFEHDNVIAVMKQPPHSPDLNPKENLWDGVNLDIHITDLQPTCVIPSCQWVPKKKKKHL